MNTAVFWGVTKCSLVEVCHTGVSDGLVMQEAAGFYQDVNKILSKYDIPGVISETTVIFPKQTAAVM